MKTYSCFGIAIVLMGPLSLCRAQQTNQQTATLPPPTQPSIVSRAANERVWERIEYQSGPNGQVIPVKHQIHELSTGICYQKNGGIWADSQEQINILADGSAAATDGQHQVYFPADIYSGAINLVTPDGLQLQSQPLALSYDDGTNTVLFGLLTNSVGQLIGPNQIIYTNAFFGVDADLVYTYRKNGFEQDVIFRAQPPAPEQFGLTSTNSRLQLLTEFLDPPAPIESASPVNPQNGIPDTTLTFGSMQMVHGKAFLTDDAGLKNNLQQMGVSKSWVVVNGRTLLVEELPYGNISGQLQKLPMPSAVTLNSARIPLSHGPAKWSLPPPRLVATTTNTVRLAAANTIPKRGFVLDYVTINSSESNFTFMGDSTYYLSGESDFSGTVVFEGGAVIKTTNAPANMVTILGSGAVVCQTGPYRPAVFTSVNDDTVGDTIWGISTGSPDFQNNVTDLVIEGTNCAIHDMRFCYPVFAIAENGGAATITATNCQFIDGCIAVYADNIGLYNVLIADSPTISSEINGGIGLPQVFLLGTNLIAENVTADSGCGFIEASGSGQTMALTNCLVTRQPLIDGSSVTFQTNALVWLQTLTAPVYQTVGGGSYYLTNGSPYRGYGTANINSSLLVDLCQRTTWPPLPYSNVSIGTNLTLGLAAWRDTNSSPDIGYHYDPLDYAFGGCVLSSNLTLATGTAAAWFEANGATYIFGQPYGISLNDGAKLSFNGSATRPCVFARSDRVQEGENGNWGNTGWNLGIVFMGSSLESTVSANFTKWSSTYPENILQDRGSKGQGFFKNCEFYIAAVTTWNVQYLYYTNCLFLRPNIALWNSPNFTLENCTALNGGLTMDRSSAVVWLVENCSFDGTGFNGSDIYGGTNHTTIDHNAYNTNNLSWQNYTINGSCNGKLEVTGSSDLLVTNYNWESSWFGDFYLPASSALIDRGSTTADQVGLYHFTTQTNQIPETNSTVDIGYHYVASDQYGNPLDSNGNGIPDYLEDSAGNGSGNWDTTLLLNVIITQPRNGSVLP